MENRTVADERCCAETREGTGVVVIVTNMGPVWVLAFWQGTRSQLSPEFLMGSEENAAKNELERLLLVVSLADQLEIVRPINLRLGRSWAWIHMMLLRKLGMRSPAQ